MQIVLKSSSPSYVMQIVLKSSSPCYVMQIVLKSNKFPLFLQYQLSEARKREGGGNAVGDLIFI